MVPGRIRIAARSSRLSMLQAEEVAQPLRELGYDVEVVGVRSLGDVDKATPLYLMREKGVFEKEVDKAVLSGRADAAVHSAKDVPAKLPGQLRLVAVPKRRSPYDAVVSASSHGLHSLPPGSRLGTSSLRRMSMARYHRRDIEVVPVRGNLDTRLSKLGGSLDALVAAEAGLERLGYQGVWERLPFVPAAGQGALAVYARFDREDVARLFKLGDDEGSRLELLAEKAVLLILGAGCKTPVGVHAQLDGSVLTVRVASVKPGYEDIVEAEVSGRALGDESAWEIAGSAAAEFARLGGLVALEEWRRMSV